MFSFGTGGDNSGGQAQAQGGRTGSGFGIAGTGPSDSSLPSAAQASSRGAFGSQAGVGVGNSGGYSAARAPSFASVSASTAGGFGGGSNSKDFFVSRRGFGYPGPSLTRPSSGGAGFGGFAATTAASGSTGGGFGSFLAAANPSPVPAGTASKSTSSGAKGFGTGGGFGSGSTRGAAGFGGLPARPTPATFAAAAATKPSGTSTGFGASGGFGTGGGFGTREGFGAGGGFGGGATGGGSGTAPALHDGGASAVRASPKSAGSAVTVSVPAPRGFGTSGGFGTGGFGGGAGGASGNGTARRNRISNTASGVPQAGFDASWAGDVSRGGTSTSADFAAPAIGSSVVSGVSFADAAKRALGSKNIWGGGGWGTSSAVATGSMRNGSTGSSGNSSKASAEAGHVPSGSGGVTNIVNSGAFGSGFGARSTSDKAGGSSSNIAATATFGTAGADSGSRDVGETTAVSNGSGRFGRRSRSGAVDSSVKRRGSGIAGQALFGVTSSRGQGSSTVGSGSRTSTEQADTGGQGGDPGVTVGRRRRGGDDTPGGGDAVRSGTAGGQHPMPSRRGKGAPVSRILGLSAADAAAMAATESLTPAFIGGGGNGKRRATGDRSQSPSKGISTSSTRGSTIVGGLGPPPLGASSSPPPFIGGRGGSGGSRRSAAGADGGGAEQSSALGSNATGERIAKARRAQRFGAAAGGSGVAGHSGEGSKGGGKSEGVGGERVKVDGGIDVGGRGSAEDVQRGSHLDEAEIKVGTVEAMCPVEERLRRVPGDLHILEKEHPLLMKPDPGDGTPQQPWLHDDLVVKRHQRAAAGMDISKPELLRTPQWLALTVDHLVMNCIDKGPHGGGDPSSAWDDPRVQEHMTKFRANNPSRAEAAEDETEQDLYNFVWDRFRMVRSDYNMQGYNPVVGLVSESSIVAHERMARWYILMHNRMSKNTVQTHRFNLKSIVETLKKLYEFYSIRVARGQVSGGLASPNECEIMAYYLLTVMQQDHGAEVQRLVKDMFRNRRDALLESLEIKGALRVVHALRSGDYVAFFRAFTEQGVMHRCLMAQYVGSMRTTAIKIIGKCYVDMSVGEVRRLLCLEDTNQTIDFLAAYNIGVESNGQVIFRAKLPRTNRLILQFKTPGEPPETPPLQDLVEPKPWRLASEWVYKGDYEPAGNKSHVAEIAPDHTANSAASLIRATSTSSTSSASRRGRQNKRPPDSTSLGAAPAVRGPSSTSTRQGLPSSLPMPPLTAGPSATPRSSSARHSYATSNTGTAQHGESGSGLRTCANSFNFSPPAGGDEQTGNPASATSSTISSAITGSGFSFARPDPTLNSRSSAADGQVSFAAKISFPSSAKSPAMLDPSPSSTTHPTLTAGDGGGTTGTASNTSAAGGGPGFPTSPNASRSGFSFGPQASSGITPAPAPGASRTTRSTSGPTKAHIDAARAAAAAASAQQAAEKASRDKAQAQAEEKRKADREAAAATARQSAVAAAAKEQRRIREAERLAQRALSENRLVAVDVYHQLPLDGTLRKRAEEARRARAAALGLSLQQGWAAVAGRKQRAVWTFWVAETQRWLETERVVEHRNQNYEEHDALAGKSPWLRRRRTRTLSGGKATKIIGAGEAGDGGLTRNAAAPRTATLEAGRSARTGTASVAGASTRRTATVMRKPVPLDLPAILGAAVAENQGTDAEAAFRAVGLTRRDGEGTGKDDPLSLPHLFWKAVLVVPLRSKGDVGAWLESKLGDGRCEGMEGYVSDLQRSQLTPKELVSNAIEAEERREVPCGNSGRSRLIHRSFRQMPRGEVTRKQKSKPSFTRWMHLCVQRVDFDTGNRVECSPQLSAKLKAASVIVFTASPKDNRRFFFSPCQPKPDWSEARDDLQKVLDAASPSDTRPVPALGAPLLVVIPVWDSALSPDGADGDANATPSRHVRQRILQNAWEGLALGNLTERGFSFRATVVGLHEFESRSRAAAAAGEGLVFAGKLEDACSRELGEKLADLSGRAPLQPLVATRSLIEMLNTAVSRATTDNRFAAASGLKLPLSPYQDPPLEAVVGAATQATLHILELLCRKVGQHPWPIREFAIAANRERQAGLLYVLGAARPTGGELTQSFLYPETPDDFGEIDRLRSLVCSSAGLPVDWAERSPSDLSPAVTRLIRAATLPLPIPADLVKTFSDDVLAGREEGGARALGLQEAWTRLDRLEAYLGRGVLPEDLKLRLADALAGGVMIRGAPPPWRTLVRHAVTKRLRLAAGPDGTRPVVVHFVVATGEQRLANAGVVPGLLEAGQSDVPRSSDSGVLVSDERLPQSMHGPLPAQQEVVQKASAALKRVAPIMAEIQGKRDKQRLVNASRRRTTPPGGVTPKRKRGGWTEVTRSGSPPKRSSYDRDRQETIERLRRETEELRESTERERVSAEAGVELDKSFLRSLGLNLTGSVGNFTAVTTQSSPVSCDVNEGVSSERNPEGRAAAYDSPRWPLFGERARAPGAGDVRVAQQGEDDREVEATEAKQYELRRRVAESTLSATEYRRWIIREDVLKDRRKQEKIWARVFNGDPLSTPPTGAGLWTG